jgi:hypothetical protein
VSINIASLWDLSFVKELAQKNKKSARRKKPGQRNLTGDDVTKPGYAPPVFSDNKSFLRIS